MNQRVTVDGNRGKISTNLNGTLPEYGDVWFSNQVIANILSMAKVKDTCHVSYDSNIEDAFVVRKSRKAMGFKKSNKGLFYFDVRKEEVCFTYTVEENKKVFFQRQVKGAERARRFLLMVGRPSMKDLANMIKLNLLPNLPVTLEEVKVTEKIYGKDLGSIMGKTTRNEPA
eukprot:8437440-Ditylum_brightwellii.AAC.1